MATRVQWRERTDWLGAAPAAVGAERRRAAGSADRLDCIPNVVAVVGCDGTGKTTLVADLVARLDTMRRTERRYMGLVSGETGDRIKRLPILGAWMERRLVAKVRRAQDMKKKLPGSATAVVMYLFSLFRASRLRRLMRLARSGVLVIADRYPQADVPGFHYDGPGLTADRSGNWLVRRLAGREQRLYQWMAEQRPTLVIRLTIDAATAFARKSDHPLPELRDKIAIMPQLGFNGARIVEIDARQPYPKMLEAALQAIAGACPA